MTIKADYYRRYEPVFSYWKIDGHIGEDCTGDIFKITCNTPNGQAFFAALKTLCIRLPDDQASEEELSSRLDSLQSKIVEDYTRMSELSVCPNIVKYDNFAAYAAADGRSRDILMKTELLTPFSEIIPTMNDEKAVKLGVDMCRAFSEMHRRNIYHRCFCTDSIFADNFGNYKLSDFGIGHSALFGDTMSSQIKVRSFMAPELFRGASCTESSQIYSLGLVLYSCINGNTLPFMKNSISDATEAELTSGIKQRIEGNALPELASGNKALCNIIYKACSFNIQDRFKSFDELRAALERIQMYSAIPSDDSNDTTVVVPNAVYNAGNTNAAPSASEAPAIPKKKSKAKFIIPIIIIAVAVLIAGGIFGGKLIYDNFIAEKDSDESESVNNNGKVGEDNNSSDSKKPSEKNNAPSAGNNAEPSGENDQNKKNDSEKQEECTCGKITEEVGEKVYLSAFEWEREVEVSCECGLSDDKYTETETIDGEETAVDYGKAGKLFYVLDENGSLTLRGNGNMPSYNDADSYPWYEHMDSISSVVIEDGVTSIGSMAFSGYTALESIDLGNTLEQIESRAFGECDSLTSVHIPASVTEIDSEAFISCSAIKGFKVDSDNEYFKAYGGVLFNHEKTELVCYPASSKSSTYTIPDTVTDIHAYAFADCNNLSGITVSGNVKIIPEKAFENCTKLTSVSIPEGTSGIFSNAFDGCVSLRKIDVDDNNVSYTSIDGVLYEYSGDGMLLIKYPAKRAGSSYTLDENVTHIGNNAFRDVVNLRSLRIENDDISFEDNVFGEDDAQAPDNFTVRGVADGNIEKFADAFDLRFTSDNIGTTETAPDTTDETNEESVETNVPADMDSEQDAATPEIESPTDSETTEATPVEDEIADGTPTDGETAEDIPVENQPAAEETTEEVIEYGEQVSVNPSRQVYASGNCGNNVSWSISDDGMLFIAGSGNMKNYNNDYDTPWYRYRSSITKVYIDHGVTSIGSRAFMELDSLAAINIPETVTTLGEYAFYGSDSIQYINLPASVHTIGKGALFHCKGILAFNVDPANSTYCSVNGVLLNRQQTVIIQYPAAKADNTYTIPYGVTALDYGSFSDSVNLRTVYIPGSVTRLGERAFVWCTGLKEIYIPASVTLIETRPFRYCRDLVSITVDNANPYYGSYDGILFNKTGTRLITYPASRPGTSYIIPGAVTSVDDNAFLMCQNLTEVIAENAYTSFGKEVFDSFAKQFVLKGFSGSTIQGYARKHGISYVNLPS